MSMRAEYDLSKMKSRRNPYASKLKKPVTMRLSEDVLEYFKGMAAEAGVPYQSLINLYLRDCIAQNRRVEIKWLRRTNQDASITACAVAARGER
jgi:BrnA antitoxin of type II toxin-antitoxin system